MPAHRRLGPDATCQDMGWAVIVSTHTNAHTARMQAPQQGPAWVSAVPLVALSIRHHDLLAALAHAECLCGGGRGRGDLLAAGLAHLHNSHRQAHDTWRQETSTYPAAH